MAEEIREHMAELGYRTVDEMVGQTQRLEVNTSVQHYKSRGLDLSPLLTPAADLNPEANIVKMMSQDHGLDAALDNKLIEQAQSALNDKTPVTIR